MTDIAKCAVCGEPMPPGEQMFKFHGYSGPCPKPAQTPSTARGDLKAAATALYMAGRWDCANLSGDEQARMWEALRDALGLSVGTATTAGVHSRHPAAPAGVSLADTSSTPRAAEAEWLPIESAPKDGSSFLVYLPDERRQIQVAWQNSNGVMAVGACFSFDLSPITHWRPLPAPPALTPPSAKGES